MDTGGYDTIPKSIQLIAGRTGQEFNLKKNRKGAFWEDQYHTTGVETGRHLLQCLIYIDLNMVRAGVVKHPIDYPNCGFNEIQAPKQHYALIEYEQLKKLLGINDIKQLAVSYRSWLEDALSKKSNHRESKWTQSVAVGSESYVTEILEGLGFKARGRSAVERDGAFELREPEMPYNSIFGYENEALRAQNEHNWDVFGDISIR